MKTTSVVIEAEIERNIWKMSTANGPKLVEYSFSKASCYKLSECAESEKTLLIMENKLAP